MRGVLALAVGLLLAAAATAGATVGGSAAARDAPYVVALERTQRGGPFTFACGATLVAPDRVLTAAACVADENDRAVDPRTVRVLAGTKVRSRGGERLAVTAVELHPKFEAGSFSHDAAVLSLERAPTLGRPIRLADPAREQALWAPGRRQVVLGWGAPEPEPLYATDVLQEISVPRIDDRSCNDSTVGGIWFDVMLCAGDQASGQDVCATDQGGPMVAVAPGGEAVQTGIISHYFGCANPPSDAVYARVGDRVLFDFVQARLPKRATLSRRALGRARMRLTCGAAGAVASACRVRIALRSGRVLRVVRLRPGRPTTVRIRTRRALALTATVTTSAGTLFVTRRLRARR